MIGPGDERFRLGDQDYWFELAPGGAQGFASDSPFAPKSVTGERSYADYDPFSAVAFADLSGGMGQERATDTTRYYDARNVDARGGRIILGPQVHYNTDTLPGLDAHADALLRGTIPDGVSLSYLSVDSTRTKVAARFSAATGVTTIDRVWLALRGTSVAGVVTVSIRNDSAGEPGTTAASTVLSRDELQSFGSWAQASFSPSVTIVSGNTYWLVVEHDGAADAVGWYGGTSSSGGYSAYHNAKEWNGSGWVGTEDYWHLIFQYDDPNTRPDSSLRYVLGAGEDGITRLWGYSGRRLYYIGSDSLPVAVQDGAGNVYQAAAEVVDACWYRAAGDGHPYLYLALGDGTDMVKFDGNIGAEQWTTVSGHQARRLAVHDAFLWYADERNMVAATDGTTWGNAVACGDKTYPIRNMVSWAGYLYVGKDDGLYRITYPAGYPTSGIPTATKVLDFSPMANAVNFAAMCEHQGDLIFSLEHGLIRYTSGGVVTPISPDTGLNLAADERAIYRAARSAMNVLWVAAEGHLGGGSSLLALVDWHWHPVVTVPRAGDMMRSVAVEPGLYGPEPRVWFKAGLQVAYVLMPATTQRRWLWSNMDYAESGHLDLSWVDGNIRTINKDWLAVEVDALDVGAGAGEPYVVVSWRPDENAEWTEIGVVNSTGITSLAFPAGTYGAKAQLRIALHRGTLDSVVKTPQVQAVVLKYMERPEDSVAFTRTYLLGERGYNRAGASGRRTLAEWVSVLRTLRESAEPLTYWPVWGLASDTSYQVHWVNYAVTEQRAEVDGAMSFVVTVKMQRL